ncbi:MAG TPA: 30S ribosomal protein S3 [Candidatus Parcubacteria bacterium]|jgi:small subunit ribosomal protein S3|nr:30S ribosomal protein S3 [Candidatus Parcubacteria bacterium]
MAHKVHPKSYRLKRSADWDSRWMSKKNLRNYLQEDFVIREFLNNRLKEAAVKSVEIERFPVKVNIIINTARPGLIIGRGGQGVQELEKALKKEILRQKLSTVKNLSRQELKIEIKEVKNPWTEASIVAQWMAQQIEKRLPHRRVLKQTLDKVITNKDVKGVRLEVSGRLGGSEFSRSEKLLKGRLPRQTLRSIIDYGTAQAYCTYGVIGIKVWIYKGERF